jgi:CRP-like cAMP-binding protein
MIDTRNLKYDCNECMFRTLSCHYMPAGDFEIVRRTSLQLQFKRGETIFKQDLKSTNLLYLHKGIVKFNYENDSGKNFILTIVSGPKLLGGANLFFKEKNIFSLIAVEDCDACLIDSRAFKNMLVSHGKFALVLVEKMTEMFEEPIFNFISLAHKQVYGRVADILIYLSSNVYKNDKFNLSLTRKELAEFAACSAENVIMTLSKFNREGIISLEGRQLAINNMGKLKEISKLG